MPMQQAFRKFAGYGYVILCLAVVWLTRDHVFFWDTVQLGSKHAHWYYENGFGRLLLPDAIDSGHPPVFGMYLAALWQLFGKSLPVSHLGMLPFLLLMGWALFRLGDRLGGPALSPLLVLLVLADPVVAGQAVLVSPDLALLSFFLLGLVGVLERRSWLTALAAVGLAAISTRGMMTVLALYLFELIAGPEGWLFQEGKKKGLGWMVVRALPYAPSGLFALAFLGYHYLEKGWIGYHADSPWAPGFERVGMAGVLKNFGLLGWRLLDFGRIFLWPAGIALAFGIRPELRKDRRLRQLLVLVVVAVPALCTTFVLYQFLQNHRYLLPLLVGLTLLFYRLLALAPAAWRAVAFVVAFAGLLTGNLWVYPDRIAQGWDATLAHWPYYPLREAAIDYLEKESIPLDSVGTAFPEIGPLKYRDLSGRMRGFKAKDLARDDLVLYSNIMNDFTDEEIGVLRAHWREKQRWERGGVKLVLYARQ